MILNSKFYKQATDLNQMAVFEWNIEYDTLIYDEMMQILIQHYIPQVKVTEHLLKARLVHPEDRIEFKNYIDKILKMKTKHTATFQDYELDFRVFAGYRYYTWMKIICRAEIENFSAVRVVGFLKNIEKDRKERDKLKSVIERDSMTGLYFIVGSNSFRNFCKVFQSGSRLCFLAYRRTLLAKNFIRVCEGRTKEN